MLWEILSLLLLFLIVYWYVSKPKNLPPGPNGVPLLGFLPWMIYYFRDREKLIEYLNTFGDMTCVRIGFSYIVLINKLSSVREAFQNNAEKFAGRNMTLLQSEITHGKGILSADGKYQRENRRFILRSLRDMGFGKLSFEDQILESINTMFESIDDHISKNPNKSLNFEACLTEAVAANITKIIFGEDFSKEEMKNLLVRMNMVEKVPPFFFIANSVPYMATLVKIKAINNLVGVEKFKVLRTAMENVIMKYIKSHRENFDRNSITDFIYSYFEEQSLHQSSKEESYWWDDEQIKHACSDLIGAALGTITNTVSWFLFYLANDKQWLQKVFEEIDSVIGRQKRPTVRDLTNLPICEATILETLRLSNLSAIGFPHMCVEKAKISGYTIPKGATILMNTYCISRNKSVFSDPNRFNPAANFLSADLKEVINKDKFLPFGIGRRSCIGESLARMELVLFFITIFQKYTVSLDPKAGMAPISKGVFRMPVHKILQFDLRP